MFAVFAGVASLWAGLLAIDLTFLAMCLGGAWYERADYFRSQHAINAAVVYTIAALPMTVALVASLVVCALL